MGAILSKGLWNIAKQTVTERVMWFSEVDGGHQMNRDCEIIWNWKEKTPFQALEAVGESKPPHQRKNIICHPGGGPQCNPEFHMPGGKPPSPYSSSSQFQPWEGLGWLAAGGGEQMPLGEKAEKPRAYFLPSTLSPKGLSSIKSGMRGSVSLTGSF